MPVYVHWVDSPEGNWCYYSNTFHSEDFPDITYGDDIYREWVEVTIYESSDPVRFAENRHVKFCLMNNEFVLPEYCTGLCSRALSVTNLDKTNPRSVRGFRYMFREFQGESIDLSSWYWNGGTVYYAEGMFMNCRNLKWIDISGMKNCWDRGGAALYFNNWMFAYCPNLEAIYTDEHTDWNAMVAGYGDGMFTSSIKLHYYYDRGQPMNEDAANSYCSVWRRRYVDNSWEVELVKNGGFFTIKTKLDEHEVYIKYDSNWRLTQPFEKDSTWKDCQAYTWYNELDIPPYDPEYGWEYYYI